MLKINKNSKKVVWSLKDMIQEKVFSQNQVCILLELLMEIYMIYNFYCIFFLEYATFFYIILSIK